jgi:hypothetical protein
LQAWLVTVTLNEAFRGGEYEDFIFCDKGPCRPFKANGHFGGKHETKIKSVASMFFFDSEYEGDMFFRNVG